MSSTIRTFIGLQIPATPELGDILSEVGRLGRGLRVTDKDSLHLTLKFLGDTAVQQLPAIADVLAAVARSTSGQRAQLVALGAFPTVARPAVVWAGLQPVDGLKQLAAALDRQLEPLGFVPEARPYHPHLTLARVKSPVAGLREFIEAHRETLFGEVLIDRVELFKSELTAQGSRYTVLESVMLKDS